MSHCARSKVHGKLRWCRGMNRARVGVEVTVQNRVLAVSEVFRLMSLEAYGGHNNCLFWRWLPGYASSVSSRGIILPLNALRTHTHRWLEITHLAQVILARTLHRLTPPQHTTEIHIAPRTIHTQSVWFQKSDSYISWISTYVSKI